MCGYYLAIGMSMNEYWNASPHLARYYREAHRLRTEQRNQELWLQGLYIYNAFGVVLANAFGKKGSKKHKYMDRPIDLFGKTEGEIEAEAIRERNRVVNTLNRIKAAFDARKAAGKDGHHESDKEG